MSAMSRAYLVLSSDAIRQKARDWIDKAERDTRIEFKKPRRTLPQNARMWAMLTDVASQLRWHGLRLSTEDWKLMFLDALKREVRMVPNLMGNGFVSLGRSSSDLSIGEMADLITLIEAFGAEHGVQFSDPNREAA